MIDYIEVPQLVLTAEQKANLLEYFHEVKQQYGQLYVTKSGRVQDLMVVVGFPSNDLIKQISDRLPAGIIHNTYFLANNGIDVHQDDDRYCIISFELQNTENVPMDIYDEDRVLIDRMYYKGMPMMWNPKIVHGAGTSSTQRIFFQIEMRRDLRFPEVLDMYLKGELIK